jgi:hypothetical protein
MSVYERINVFFLRQHLDNPFEWHDGMLVTGQLLANLGFPDFAVDGDCVTIESCESDRDLGQQGGWQRAEMLVTGTSASSFPFRKEYRCHFLTRYCGAFRWSRLTIRIINSTYQRNNPAPWKVQEINHSYQQLSLGRWQWRWQCHLGRSPCRCWSANVRRT